MTGFFLSSTSSAQTPLRALILKRFASTSKGQPSKTHARPDWVGPSSVPEAATASPTEPWKAHRAAMKRKFPQGFNPPARLSRESMDIVRKLHLSDPIKFSTPALAKQFKISAEGVRRILKSKWKPSKEKLASERARNDKVVPVERATQQSSATSSGRGNQDREDETQELQQLVAQWRASQSN